MSWIEKTVGEAIAWMEKKAKTNAGCRCPCCGQRVKIYNRKLTSEMAYALCRLYSIQSKEFWRPVNILREAKLASGEYSKTRFFGLIMQVEKGQWSLTKTGIAFVEGRIRVARSVLVFHNRKVGESDDMISISEALDNKWQWEDIVRLPEGVKIQERMFEMT